MVTGGWEKVWTYKLYFITTTGEFSKLISKRKRDCKVVLNVFYNADGLRKPEKYVKPYL